jgi:uncharacterized protein
MSCAYCFVRKTNERMSFEVAQKSIDLLLSSPGENKLMALYGGDPFLEFDLIKEMTIYARKMEKSHGKNLTISICTNLTVLTQERIEFIKNHNLMVTVSLVGGEEVHNKYRPYLDGGGTYAQVIRNFKKLAVHIPEQNYGISYVVIPFISHLIYDNFVYLLNLGISRNFNFEIIQDFEKWTRQDQANFMTQYSKITELVLEKIDRGNHIFINHISWELARSREAQKLSIMCPFRYLLEVYPSGDMAFSPFLLNRPNKKRYIVGNILDGFNGRYQNCVFNRASPQCVHCHGDYFESVDHRDNSHLIIQYYSLRSLKAARIIRRKSPPYVDYCAKYLCY